MEQSHKAYRDRQLGPSMETKEKSDKKKRGLSEHKHEPEVIVTKKRRTLKEARALMNHLHYIEEVQSLKRRWLTRRWPEHINFSGSSSKDLRECGFLEDRYIPESILRDDNSAVVLRSKIQEGFDALKGNFEFDHHSHQCNVEHSDLKPEKIQGLPIKELFASLPVLLEYFRLPALRSLADIVTGKPYHSTRMYTVKKIQHGLSMLFGQSGEDALERLQKVQDILRDPENVCLGYTAVLTDMPSSGLAAAKCTLSQLQKLPIHTLYTMNRKLRGKLIEIKLELKDFCGKKVSLAKRMKVKGEKLLEGIQEGDPLPERIKKALIVASLSARQSCGEDGGLLQSLGPISPEVIALHNDFLMAISHVQKLKYPELKDVFSCLSSDNCWFSSKTPRRLRHALRMFLLGWLFESCDRIIPEPVMNAVTMINRLGAVKEAKEALRERNAIGSRTEINLDTELECVLNVSSHLKQITHGWIEHVCLDPGIDEVILDDYEDICEPWFAEDSCNTIELDGNEEAYVGESCWEPKSLCHQEPRVQENAQEDFPDGELKNSSQEYILRENNSHGEETGKEIGQQIQEICDEAGLFTYRLIGCLMDDFLSRKGDALEAPVRRYLRTGLPATAEGTDKSESCSSEQSTDTSMVLNTAQRLWPQMPTSVIEKVKLSLGAQ